MEKEEPKIRGILVVRKLERLRDDANLILACRKSLGAPMDGVHAADLSCIEATVETVIESNNRLKWIWSVKVAEAEPDAHQFQSWLSDQLNRVGYDAVEVHTKWEAM